MTAKGALIRTLVMLASSATVGCCAVWHGAGGTDFPDQDSGDGTGVKDPGADLAVISMVVKQTYGLYGGDRTVIFLDDETFGKAGAAVEQELGIRVLPEAKADRSSLSLPPLTPVDPETGEIGVAITLGRFRLGDDGRLTVEAGAVLSGLNAQGFEFVLERSPDGEGWVIVSVTETWVA